VLFLVGSSLSNSFLLSIFHVLFDPFKFQRYRLAPTPGSPVGENAGRLPGTVSGWYVFATSGGRLVPGGQSDRVDFSYIYIRKRYNVWCRNHKVVRRIWP
jgi:hypothetical protein